MCRYPGSRLMWLGMMLLGFLAAPALRAYPDTTDGAMATAATAALAKGDVTPILRWVKAEQEEELRTAFQEAAVVRTKGPEAQALADKYFSETLVRLHRLGRNEPYTGLQPASTQDPLIGIADKAVADGHAEELTKALSAAVNESVMAHYNEANTAKATADTSVAAGRDYVDAYESYMSFVADLYTRTQRDAAEDDQDVAGEQEPQPAAQGAVVPPAKGAARQAAKGQGKPAGAGGGGKTGAKKGGKHAKPAATGTTGKAPN